MTARRLTHLTARLLLALPLAACAAQPGPGQASGRPDAPAPAAPAPVAAPATPVTQDAQPGAATRQGGTVTAAPRHDEPGRTASRPAQNMTHGAAAEPRAAAPSAAAATGTSATGTAAAGTTGAATAATGTAADTAPATGTAATAPAATPAAPDVVAPRAATPGPTVPPVAMPAGSATGSLLQTLFALVLVLAVLGALAWFLKRYGPRAGGGNANLRVVGSLNLGGRERIMVVEVGNQWIVVGASPGRINALATLPRQDGQNGVTDASDAALAPQANAAPGAHSFADWLKQTIDKRK